MKGEGKDREGTRVGEMKGLGVPGRARELGERGWRARMSVKKRRRVRQ